MSTNWIAQQILSVSRSVEPPRAKPSHPPGTVSAAGNAPAGVMREGGATHAVFGYLSERRKRHAGWASRHQIVAAVGRHHKAVDWALVFLRTVKPIETSQDPRCSRYLRYRAISPIWQPPEPPSCRP